MVLVGQATDSRLLQALAYSGFLLNLFNLIPIGFLAIRLAEAAIHPVAFNSSGPQMAGSQFGTFMVCLVAMLSLGYFFYRFELASKQLDAELRELRELVA